MSESKNKSDRSFKFLVNLIHAIVIVVFWFLAPAFWYIAVPIAILLELINGGLYYKYLKKAKEEYDRTS